MKLNATNTKIINKERMMMNNALRSNRGRSARKILEEC